MLSKTTSGCATCVSARLAALRPPSAREFKSGWISLAALLFPGLVLAVCLFWAAENHPRYEWLKQPPSHWPWEFWTMGLAGGIASIGGILDWSYHRWVARCKIGQAEKRLELLAMGVGGGSMLTVMLNASISDNPGRWLIPAMVVLMFTVSMICYDEFIYHRRRCTRWETLWHRILTGGMGVAWLGWAHWCFAR